MLTLVEAVEAVREYGDPRYRRRPWRPANRRRFNSDERLVYRTLRAHDVPYEYERWLLPLQINARGQVTSGLCPDFRVFGDGYIEQYIEIGGGEDLENKRVRIERAVAIHGALIHLIDSEDLQRVEHDPDHLLRMLVSTEPVALAA
jgi:hypothetical protein